jgi:hypothetical protein
MARYTIRIELHDAAADRYGLMYVFLEAAGFSDTFTTSDGARYRLPFGEYGYVGAAEQHQVLELAKACAARMTTDYSVLVTEVAGRAWVGLERV